MTQPIQTTGQDKKKKLRTVRLHPDTKTNVKETRETKMADQAFAKGLEGVIATDSKICRVDGINGKLYYRGYSIQDLAANSTFEETTYLLVYGRLPSKTELADFQESMRGSRELNHTIQNMIRDFPAQGAPMELLQSVISYLSSSLVHKIEHNATCDCRRTLHQISQITTVLATHQRFREGKEYLHSRKDLSHGANFLYLLRGKEPTEEEGRIMDVCMILHAEHGLNASTFTARVVASSLASCYSSISAAIGSLSGSLHGGANEKLMDMVDEIGSIDNVDAWLDQALAEKRKIMGMGHRVYRVKDPRSIVMEEMFEKLAKERGERQLYDLLKRLEASFHTRMEETGKSIYPNVDYFSGAMYTLLGIERDLFTPIFAAARAPGWLAHILEQRKDNRLYRPKSLYVGPEPRPYVTIDQR